jgi:hypothetical protein
MKISILSKLMFKIRRGKIPLPTQQKKWEQGLKNRVGSK